MNELTLDISPSGRNGAATVTVRCGPEILACDTLNLARAKQRARFVAAICDGRPGIDRAALEAELLRAAAALAISGSADASQPAGEMPEVDASRIVRPELFFTSELAGLAIPAMLPVGDTVAGRWMLYLRWRDGEREHRPLPSFIELPDRGDKLWLLPQPPEPSATTSAGWSADARRRWLAGEPAPNAADVFRDLAESFARFIDLPEGRGPGITATVICWVMLTYIYPAWPAVPYLYLGGPLGSGKTRVLEVLSRIVYRPLCSSNMTAAALFRSIHAQGGVVLFDEAERLKHSRDPEVGEILSLLLAGYRRNGAALRLEPVGDSFRAVSFSVFGPKALSSVSGLPPTLASRSIPLIMFRASARSDKPKRRVEADSAGWQRLRDQLHALALEHGPAWLELAQRTDVVPEGLSGRDYELWQPLLAIAAFVEESGLPGLVKLMQSHAVETTKAAKDDTQPDQDAVLLRILAQEIRGGTYPTPSELLARAQKAEPAAFKNWTARAVASHLKRYDIPAPTKSGSRREFRTVTPEHLARIQEAYGIDLDCEE